MAKTAVFLSENEIAKMERDALGRVGKTISAIENAVLMWNASKTKPPELRQKIMRFKKFHEKLKEWSRRFGLAGREKGSTSRRISMLRDFVKICYAYENA